VQVAQAVQQMRQIMVGIHQLLVVQLQLFHLVVAVEAVSLLEQDLTVVQAAAVEELNLAQQAFLVEQEHRVKVSLVEETVALGVRVKFQAQVVAVLEQ
jgi:hypothetical protein